jgi:hypothetical protein
LADTLVNGGATDWRVSSSRAMVELGRGGRGWLLLSQPTPSPLARENRVFREKMGQPTR